MHLKDADNWLWKWWLWSRRRDEHGCIKQSPMFAESKSSRQWDDTSEIADIYRHKAELRMIDRDVMGKLEPVHAAAIMFEFRNRSGGRVWRHDGNYRDALAVADSMLRDVGVL